MMYKRSVRSLIFLTDVHIAAIPIPTPGIPWSITGSQLPYLEREA
jgi:hypothetical protein